MSSEDSLKGEITLVLSSNLFLLLSLFGLLISIFLKINIAFLKLFIGSIVFLEKIFWVSFWTLWSFVFVWSRRINIFLVKHIISFAFIFLNHQRFIFCNLFRVSLSIRYLMFRLVWSYLLLGSSFITILASMFVNLIAKTNLWLDDVTIESHL
jgi:hypothetical protein